MTKAKKSEPTLDEIWLGDLLNRRAEAQLLEDYIESVAARTVLRDDLRAFTIAIDTSYGEGKTFFLRRFADHLALKHPVAFVDAWADDLADEPLTALAATLKTALDPLLKKDTAMAKKFANVLETAGKVAKIAMIGAAKRALGLVITSAAVAAADEVIAVVGEQAEPLAGEASASGEKIIDGMEKAITSVAPNKLMAERIAEFEQGQKALAEMKQALAAIVSSLEGKNLSAPIVVVIDELDRCRPSYAIKLLEEVKHLFDVPGLVFVFGMHGEQLARSISGAYGPAFNGRAYLRRFIGRTYKLKQPALTPLLATLLARAGLQNNQQLNPGFNVTESGFSPKPLPLDEFLARYMGMYSLTARDAHTVVDMLQTCVALAPGQELYLAYLAPLLMSRLIDEPSRELAEPTFTPEWNFVYYKDGGRQIVEVPPLNMAFELQKRFKWDNRRLSQDADAISLLAWHMKGGTSGLGDPSNYPDLLDAVGRFTVPTEEA